MHAVVLHEDVYESHPWVANAVFEAMERAKDVAVARLYNTDALHATLPWLIDHVEEARSVLGDDFWPYGFEPNRPTLEALTRYSYEQGLSERKVDPEGLFVPELRDVDPEIGTRVQPDEP